MRILNLLLLCILSYYASMGGAAIDAPSICVGEVTVLSNTGSQDEFLFVTGSDNFVYYSRRHPGQEGAWNKIEGITVPPCTLVTAISRAPGTFEIFVVGSDGKVQTTSGGVSTVRPWTWIMRGITKPGAPVGAVIRSANTIVLFVTRLDGRVWTTEGRDGNVWRGWQPIGTKMFPHGTRISAVSRTADAVDIFATALDGKICTTWLLPGERNFHEWVGVQEGVAVPGAPIGAVAQDARTVGIFVVGLNGQVWYTFGPGGGTMYRGWMAMPGIMVPHGAYVNAISPSSGRVDVYATGNDKVISTATLSPNFERWRPILQGRARPGSPVTVGSFFLIGLDTRDLFVIGLDDRVWRTEWQLSSNTFRGWVSMRGPKTCVCHPITFYAQNTALLPNPLFKGEDKQAIINGVMKFLTENRPDVVALSEVWLEDERDQIINAMNRIYPHARQGPGTSSFLGAGLVILSKFPITITDQSIYKNCAGLDCGSNKGILFVRVKPPMGQQIDVFLTHTQDPDAIGTLSAQTALSDQLDHLAAFVMAMRDHHLPAVVIGDLNINGLVSSDYKNLLFTMDNPVDAWKSNHPNEPGFTWDDRSCFESSLRNPSCAVVLREKEGCVGVFEFLRTFPNFPPCDQLARGVNGQRLDYFLGYSGLGVDAAFRNTKVIKIILPNGHDLSDHMGLWTELVVSPQPPPSTAPISKVTVTFNRFNCLTATDGPLEPISSFVGSDEIEVSLTIRANGAGQETGRAGVFDDINSGSFQFVQGQTLSVSNINTPLIIQPNIWEVDDFNFIFSFRTGEASLGINSRTLTLDDLRYLRGKQMNFGMRGTRAGGDYVARVSVRVDFTPPPPPPPISPAHACAGQFPGPEGCLNQFLRIASPSFEPNAYVQWSGKDLPVRRMALSPISRNIRWDFKELFYQSYQIRGKDVTLCLASISGGRPTTIDCVQCLFLASMAPCTWTFPGNDVTVSTQIRNEDSKKCLSMPRDLSMPLQLVTCDASNEAQLFKLANAPI